MTNSLRTSSQTVQRIAYILKLYEEEGETRIEKIFIVIILVIFESINLINRNLVTQFYINYLQSKIWWKAHEIISWMSMISYVMRYNVMKNSNNII